MTATYRERHLSTRECSSKTANQASVLCAGCEHGWKYILKPSWYFFLKKTALLCPNLSKMSLALNGTVVFHKTSNYMTVPVSGNSPAILTQFGIKPSRAWHKRPVSASSTLTTVTFPRGLFLPIPEKLSWKKGRKDIEKDTSMPRTAGSSHGFFPLQPEAVEKHASQGAW